jgi:pimeloyl-ACP methyl ester carboxylesterase
MKNIILIVCFILSMTAFTQKKFIWLHGLEGAKGPNTWDIYQQYLTATNGFVIEYPSDNTIAGIANRIYQSDIKPIEVDDDLVVIAHSMGGLVARSLTGLSPKIKGIITVGTPNSGSVLLKNTLSGKTYDFFHQAIRMASGAVDNSLLSGIFSGFPVTTIAAPIVIPITIFKNSTRDGVLTSLKIVLQTGMGIYALSHPCIRDMLPGSALLQHLNTKTDTVPHVNIYGAEDNWQVVRAIGSLSKINDVKNPQYRDQSFDQEYVPKMQAGLVFISQIQQTHNLVYKALAVPAIFMPWIWLTRELVLKARLEWDALYRYLDVGMHADFASNMGAVEYHLQDYCIPTGIDLQKLSCKKSYVPFILENDGILSRQDVISGMEHRENIYNVRVLGVNHQEMGNHIEMRKLLEEIIINKKYGNAFSR